MNVRDGNRANTKPNLKVSHWERSWWVHSVVAIE